MATTPQAPRGAQMADSTPEVLGSSAARAPTTAESGPSLPVVEAQPEEPAGSSEALVGRVEEIRRLFGSSVAHLFSPLVDSIRRRLGLAPVSSGALALAGSLGVVLRLALALLVTALVGQWADIPWGRWSVILVFYGLFDATQPLRMPPLDVDRGRGPGGRWRR